MLTPYLKIFLKFFPKNWAKVSAMHLLSLNWYKSNS